jgi:signal transduction histidine kinase
MIKRLRFSALNVALSFVALSLVALALFAMPLWYAWRNTIEQGRTELLQANARKLTDLYTMRGIDALVASIDIQVGKQFGEQDNIITLLADPNLAKLAGNLPEWPKEISRSPGTQTVWIGVGRRLVRASLLHVMLPGGYHLLVGRDVARFEKLETLFLYGLGGAALIVLSVGVAGGLLVRRTLLSKVNDINQAAFAIMHGNLSHRLPAHPGENELNVLVETENRMLDQIEHLIEGIRNVSNAIAHDLRTPLAELRSRLEELTVTRPEAELTFTEIDGAIGDVDRVIAIFNALLRMAEIDTGVRRSGFVIVDVSTIAAEAVEFYHPVAELKGMTLTFATNGPATLPGDPLLLAQAVGNLIDNALKYVSKNGTISVATAHHPDGTIKIVVADDGPGVPDAEKPKVLERFYRSDASRGTPGAGLGLSLVAAVAKLHGGALDLADNHPGLRAMLTLRPPASITEPAGPIAATSK